MNPSAQNESTAPLFQLCLRITHPTIDPTEITRRLELEPEHTINAGADISGDGVRRLHTESYWIAELSMPTLEAMRAAALAAPAEKTGRGKTTRKQQEQQILGMQFVSLSKEDLPFITGAKGYDIFIFACLKRLESQRKFLQKINQEGGSITLLIQRRDHDRPVSMKQTLGRLADLGIELEID
jgi:hypothetical protein